MRIFAFATGFLAVLIASPCTAQEHKSANGTITTTGTATVDVRPDTVRVTFGHQIRLTTLKDARSESDRQARKISDALKALKIDGLKVATTTNSVQVFLSSNPGGGAAAVPDMPLAPSGYQVTTWFSVTAKATEMDKLRELSKRVSDAALDNGANLSVGSSLLRDNLFLGGGGGLGGGIAARALTRAFSPGVEIFREDVTEAEHKALKAAVKNALAKAEALASGANRKIQKIVSVTDDLERPGVPDRSNLDDLMYSPFSGYSRPETPQPPRTSVSVRVRITCSIEDK